MRLNFLFISSSKQFAFEFEFEIGHQLITCYQVKLFLDPRHFTRDSRQFTRDPWHATIRHSRLYEGLKLY